MLNKRDLLHVTVYNAGRKLITFGRIVDPARSFLERHRFDKLPHDNKTTSPNITARMGATRLYLGKGS